MSKISNSIIMAALLFPAIVQARLALVIGNASLSNPVNDATDLAAELKILGLASFVAWEQQPTPEDTGNGTIPVTQVMPLS
ncbi:MAG: hypothetical protein ABFS56_32820 [Pseudomonadota bacterium]